MKFVAAWLLVCVSLVAAPAEQPKPKEYFDPDVQQLLAVHQFGFGRVLTAGERLPGEKAFAAILRKTEAIRYLVAAFDHGSPEARCYVLVALREMSDPLYESCDEKFRTNPPSAIRVVTALETAMVPTVRVNTDIARGKYRPFFVQYDEGR